MNFHKISQSTIDEVRRVSERDREIYIANKPFVPTIEELTELGFL
jgi:hypothetical protein